MMGAASDYPIGMLRTWASTPRWAISRLSWLTTGLERFALLGISGGVAVAIAYAARHPERVSHLVLFGGFPHGWFKRGSAAEIEQAAARARCTELIVPGASRSQIEPLCGIYTFEDGDSLAGERIYYNRAALLRQLGVFHEPNRALECVTALRVH